jgi:ADP-ribosyl-[dinitrogen reductase] hydrolase
MSDLRSRAQGAYLGLALGDALGAPVEFMTAREIAHRHGEVRTMLGGGWLRLAPGAVTDDTTMALALGDAIVAHGSFDAKTAADAFARWLRGKPVDCGNTCRRGIQRYLTDGSLAGPPNEGDAGNGALMRSLPLALATLGDDAALAAHSPVQCHLTHHHPLSDAATLAFGRMVHALVLRADAHEARALADALAREHPLFRFERYPGRASGYVVDTVQTVLHHVFAHDDFTTCVVRVVGCGGDTDTNAAIAGMLAGARCGAEGLPRDWLRALDADARAAILRQVDALLAISGAA